MSRDVEIRVSNRLHDNGFYSEADGREHGLHESKHVSARFIQVLHQLLSKYWSKSTVN